MGTHDGGRPPLTRRPGRVPAVVLCVCEAWMCQMTAVVAIDNWIG